MTKPDFIIIGAMKSATSTLHEQLALQPGFFMSTPKEPNFFSDDAVYQQGLSWYSSLFQAAALDDICGESSTHYTKLPDYPETILRMKAALPEVKLIYVIRHPVDRLISHYIHQWTQNVFSEDINQAIDKHEELINYSRYSMQLKPYIEAYGAENILIAFAEAFRSQPQQELERIAAFLKYPHAVRWKEDLPHKNVSNQRIRRFKGYDLMLHNDALAWIRRTFIPRSFRNAVKKQLTMHKRPEINASQMQKICEVFDADLQGLGDMLGIQLTLDNYSQLSTEVEVALCRHSELTALDARQSS